MSNDTSSIEQEVNIEAAPLSEETLAQLGDIFAGVNKEKALRAVGVKSAHPEGCLPDCNDRHHFQVFDEPLYLASFKDGKPGPIEAIVGQ